MSTPITRTLVQTSSQYGTPTLQITVELPKGSHFRRLSVELFKLAAAVEEATPLRARWVVDTHTNSDTHGAVYLELAHGTPDEVEQARAVLQSVISAAQAVA